VAKEAKKIGKEARIVYATSEGTRVAASEKAVDKLIRHVEKGKTTGEHLSFHEVPFANLEICKTFYPKSVNKKLAEGVYKDAPYKPGTRVFEAIVKEETTLIRVYGKASGKGGQFLTLESEIKGLMPKEIQERFALPYEPELKSKLVLKPGERIRFGVVNENYGQKGGGLQFDLMDVEIGIDRFVEIGEL
jgi:hypothetical protein